MYCTLFSNKKFTALSDQQPQTQKQHQSNLLQKQTIDSPMQIRLISFLGLKGYLMDKLIFRRKSSTYKIYKPTTALSQPKLFLPQQYIPPIRYNMQIKILSFQKHSVPVIRLTPKIWTDINNNKNNNQQDQIKRPMDTIIYAHGNSSDMADALKFVDKMSSKYMVEYVVFDYNGYGESRSDIVGEEVICKDMELVLAWVNRPLDKIILWGFSLGTYPVLHCASRYPVKAIILQCPIASVSCFFTQDLSSIPFQLKFKQDYFSNIQLLPLYQGRIFLIHSSGDQIIPISHAKYMFDKYVKINGLERIYFIQVMKLSHNAVHKYLVASKENDLQRELLGFLKEVGGKRVQNGKQTKEKEKQKKYKEKQNKQEQKYKKQEQSQQRKLDKRLQSILSQIKYAQFQQIQLQSDNFDEDANQLVVDQSQTTKINFGNQKYGKINCFCFPDYDYKLNRREKFKEKQ